LAKHFNNAKNKVSRRCAFWHFACEFKTNNFWDEHGDWLAEHGRFGFDTANTPTQNGEAVVRVCSDKCVREGICFAIFCFRPNGLRKVFEVHLVTNACSRRHNSEIIKSRLAPFQEVIPLAISLIFAFDVFLIGIFRPEIINHNRMVDNQMDTTTAGTPVKSCISTRAGR